MSVIRTMVTVVTVLAICSWIGKVAAQEKKNGGGTQTGKANVSANTDRVSMIRGMTVTNGDGKELGSVNDLVISSQTGEVRYAALAYGGFLGMGEKLFAVPWDALHKNFDARSGMHTLTLNIDDSALKNAPGFDRYHWPNFADAKIREGVDKHFEKLRHQGHGSDAAAPSSGTSDINKTATSTAVGNVKRDRATDLPVKDTVLRATEIMNMVIKNPNDKELGLVNDLMIQMDTGDIRYVAMSYGGIFGVGNKLFAVPWSDFRVEYNPNNHHHFLVLSVDEVTLHKASGCDRHQWPTTADPIFGGDKTQHQGATPRNVDPIVLME